MGDCNARPLKIATFTLSNRTVLRTSRRNRREVRDVCEHRVRSPNGLAIDIEVSQGCIGAWHLALFSGKLRPIKTMKKLIWLLPLSIILGAMFVAVEIKALSPPHEITISYPNLVDTSGRNHSVQLVLHPDGSVTWRDLTHRLR